MKQKKWVFLYMLFLGSLLFSVMSWPMEISPFNHPPIYIPRCPSMLSNPRKLVNFRLAKALQLREKALQLREKKLKWQKIQEERNCFITIICNLQRGGRWEDVPEKYRDGVQKYAVQHSDWAIIDAIICSISPQKDWEEWDEDSSVKEYRLQ